MRRNNTFLRKHVSMKLLEVFTSPSCSLREKSSLPVMFSLLPHVVWGRSQVSLSCFHFSLMFSEGEVKSPCHVFTSPSCSLREKSSLSVMSSLLPHVLWGKKKSSLPVFCKWGEPCYLIFLSKAELTHTTGLTGLCQKALYCCLPLSF